MFVIKRSIFQIILFQLYWSFCLGKQAEVKCVSPQYLEMETTGTINCSFNERFFAVLWYNTTNITQDEPIIHYQNTIKSGTGNSLDYYDIHRNGQLIIKNVSIEHERTFKVAYMRFQNEVPDYINVDVIVFVKSSTNFPVFDYCGKGSNKCYAEVEQSSILCSVMNARPAVELTLASRTLNGDRNISQDMIITKEGTSFASRVATKEEFRNPSLLILIVCKAFSLPGILEENESLMLAKIGKIDFSSQTPTRKYIERYNKTELSCTHSNPSFGVWKKGSSLEDKELELLMYFVLIEEEFEDIFSRDVTLGNDGSLIIPAADISHEGLYFCFFGDGMTDDVTLHQVVTTVQPIPTYPVIGGCTRQQYCVLEKQYKGNLICTVQGIRPQVQLEWTTFLDSDAHLIAFTNQQSVIEDDEGTFTIKVNATYLIKDKSLNKMTVQCSVISSDLGLFNLRTKMDLIFRKEVNSQPPKRETSMVVVIVCIFVVVIIFVGVAGVHLCIWKCHRRDLKEGNEEERILMVDKDPAKETFLAHLKQKYKDLYEAVQPVPYRGNEHRICVNNVFVTGGIQVLQSSNVGLREHWESIDSYEGIFENLVSHSHRCIIEGETGYGKSTIALQFAFDWCNSKEESILRNVEVLILLQLGQVDFNEPIFRAIKENLLPHESKLSEDDIEKIILGSNRSVLILDGFDEYPIQSSELFHKFSVCDIMARKSFQNFDVVLTTRSGNLPKDYPPATKRIRLTGFDKEASREYIRKAIVCNDQTAEENIEQSAMKNDIAPEVCHVPMLFALLVHIAYKEDVYKYGSVTSFFRHIVECFWSRFQTKARNKGEGGNPTSKCSQSQYNKLSEVAFNAVNEKRTTLRYPKKKHLSETIGEQCYKDFVRAGILEESKIHLLNNKPDMDGLYYAQPITKTRFSHKLFCEWYAVDHFLKIFKETPREKIEELLTTFDPHNLQNVYRFTCGLHPEHTDELTEFLKAKCYNNIEILCIFEQIYTLEQRGDITKVKEKIEKLNKDSIVISSYDSFALHSSFISLLKVAARNNIPIKRVYIHNCLTNVNPSKGEISVNSNLFLTSSMTFIELAITLTDRDMTKDEAINILKFASTCKSLKQLRIERCVLPSAFTDGISSESLRSRETEVKWRPFKRWGWYMLNLETGRWKHTQDGLEPTEEDFEEMLLEKAEDLKEAPSNPRKDLKYQDSFKTRD